MKKLLKGNWEAPFWGKSHSMISGRDPLGMQNSSVATYGKLLPGLTNLTNHIRYYGFYCWILEYYRVNHEIRSLLTFRNFIRRSELLKAFIVLKNFPDTGGIPGALYVRNQLLENDDSIVDIIYGADNTDEHSTYWTLRSGAFGQYFVGSLMNLGLINISPIDNSIYSCTAYGEKLAKAYDNNLKQNIKESFFGFVLEGEASLKELKTLASSFNVEDIQNDELVIYKNILSGPDSGYHFNAKPTFLRKQTIIFLLTNLNNNKINNANTLPLYAYSKAEKDNDSVIGWNYYKLNEYTHFALETIFWGMLFELSIKLKEPLNQFIDSIVDSTCKKFSDLNAKWNIKQNFNELENEMNKNNIENILTEINESIKSKLHITAMTHGITLLLSVYFQNKDKTKNTTAVVQRYNLNRDGDCLALFESLNNAELSIQQLVKQLLLRFIVNRHLYVAYRKMGSGSQNSIKFQIENNVISFIDWIEPKWTTPRLGSLSQFLIDMNILTKEYELTISGIEFMESING
jgi:hypothetical protein